MDDGERARHAARETVADIHPPGLREVIEERLAAGSMVPAVVTMASARAAARDGSAASVDDRREAVDRRAAGVQLIYEGLRLTRSLVDDDPWVDVDDADGAVDADVDVLAADVLVARGFRLLATTAAADRAVETVRAFGRAESDRAAGRPPGPRTLEANIFDLAAIAGCDAVDRVPTPGMRRYAVGLARAHGDPPLDGPESVLPESAVDLFARVDDETAADGTARRRSASDT